jgi:small-conductance mechanosensitive channel
MLEEAYKSPLLYDQRTKKEIKEEVPQLSVIVSNLKESSIELRMSVWAKTSGDAFNLMAELREKIKKRFDTEGIEIPYPYQNIVLKK